jgi:Txe/YoeB family toxin of Txe-Axe toxin-antitoxin module|tara:strand:+ start:241 stop:447 length:207 start_codon:yes stop_codon:yes gene_type:complete
MSKKRNRKKKKKTIQQMKEYLNDASRIIKTVSREVFMGADVTTRVHKDKKKYSRKVKHKKRLDNESDR